MLYTSFLKINPSSSEYPVLNVSFITTNGSGPESPPASGLDLLKTEKFSQRATMIVIKMITDPTKILKRSASGLFLKFSKLSNKDMPFCINLFLPQTWFRAYSRYRLIVGSSKTIFSPSSGKSFFLKVNFSSGLIFSSPSSFRNSSTLSPLMFVFKME